MAEKKELRFVSPNRFMFYERGRGTGLRPNYVGRSGIDNLFNNNSLAVITSTDRGIYGTVILDGQEIDFSLSYGNERAFRENSKLLDAIHKGDTMLFDEIITLSYNPEINDSPEIIGEIKKFGFREANYLSSN